ncbi:cytochrome c peroxidase [Pirellulaceae bacterium SH449]
MIRESWLMIASSLVFVLASLFSVDSLEASGDAGTGEAGYRKPSAIVVCEDSRQLAISTKNDGSVLFYSSATHELEQKLELGGSLECMLPILGGKFLAAIDSVHHAVHVIRMPSVLGDSDAERIVTLPTSRYPMRAVWDETTSTLYVSCLWSKRMDALMIARQDNDSVVLQNKTVIDMPLWPGASIVLGDQLIVSDAFGPDACRIDIPSRKITKHKDWFGSTVRSLVAIPARNGRESEIGILHSVANQFAQSNRQDIQWGILLTNDFRKIKADRLLDDAETNVFRGGSYNPVGIPGNGAAEPTDIAIHPQSGRIAIAVGGTDQVAVGEINSVGFRFVDVGRFPISVAWSSDGQELYVANQFEDSYSVIDVASHTLKQRVVLGPVRPLRPEERGEQLFHSASFSHDRWLTCASCHIEGHTNHQLTDNLGDMDFGAPKRTPSLRGIKDTAPYTWLGHQETLADQTVASIRKTMNSYRYLGDEDIEHIVAFMESLEPLPSVAEARGVLDSERVNTGRLVFERIGCSDCHVPDRYTSPDVYDVGIVDENERKHFNPPSLRGLSQRGPRLFHDNRAKGIRGVLLDEKHQLPDSLSSTEIEHLTIFLESL